MLTAPYQRTTALKNAKVMALLSFVSVFISVLPATAEAASLYLSPANGTYTVGKTFNVNINISSADQAANAVQAVLAFPPEKLSVIEVSKADSLINLWAQDPTFNNSTGRVTFEGIILNPGFLGSAGKVLRVTFKAKTEGTASVSLTSASVLANDGQGTNILSQVGNANYVFEAAVIAPRTPSSNIIFNINVLDGIDKGTGGFETSNPRPKVKFEIKNLGKPIDYYMIRIDQKDFVQWTDDGSGVYITPLLPPGRHVLIARAYYNGDKFLEASKTITVMGLPKPEITDYPKSLRSGEVLIARGQALPNAKVIVSLQKDIDNPAIYTVETDEKGEFSFVYDQKVSSGIYRFWAMTEDKRGAKSDSTDKFTVAVEESSLIKIGSAVIDTVTFIITLLALLILGAIGSIYGWHKFKLLKRKLDKEIKTNETDLRKIFTALKKDVEEQLDKLTSAQSKRRLTEEEREIRKTLLSHLDVAERFLEKELQNLENKIFEGEDKK